MNLELSKDLVDVREKIRGFVVENVGFSKVRTQGAIC